MDAAGETFGGRLILRFYNTPAELEYREREKGRIEADYQADFILLDQHPKEVAVEEINTIEVVETWHRGKRVYKSDIFS